MTTPDVVSGLDLAANGGVVVGTGNGKFGNALTLNGTTGYLANTNTSPAIPTNNLGNGLPYFDGQPFTISMWLNVPKPTSTTHYVFAMGSTTNASDLRHLRPETGSAATTESNLDAIVRNQNGTAPISHPHSTNSLFDGTWHHFAWVDSNGVVSVYQDGVLESQSIVFCYYPDLLINPFAESTSDTYLFAMPIAHIRPGGLWSAVRSRDSWPARLMTWPFGTAPFPGTRSNTS